MGMSAHDCDWDQDAFEAWAEQAERLEAKDRDESIASTDRSGA